MMVLTVRRVATPLREPWCSSISMVFLADVEKETDRWDMSLTSLPVQTGQDVDSRHTNLFSKWEHEPLGPSTVTTRDLMWILTASAGQQLQ